MLLCTLSRFNAQCCSIGFRYPLPWWCPLGAPSPFGIPSSALVNYFLTTLQRSFWSPSFLVPIHFSNTNLGICCPFLSLHVYILELEFITKIILFSQYLIPTSHFHSSITFSYIFLYSGMSR